MENNSGNNTENNYNNNVSEPNNYQNSQQSTPPQNLPPQGSKEYNDVMSQYYGENFDKSLRISFLKRLGAFLIDGLFLSLISIIILLNIPEVQSFISEYMALAQTGDLTSSMNFINENLKNETFTKYALITTLISLVILIFTETYFAASPGKLLLKIKIANLDRSSSSFNALLIRSLIKNSANVIKILFYVTSISLIDSVSTLVSFIILFGCLMALRENRQALHDIIAKTTVYDVEDIKL